MLERIIEKTMYSMRWLLAPIYLGLSLALIALGIKFFQELIHVTLHIGEVSETNLILVTLSLVDMALVAGLLIMVMFSGYENFVSKIDIDDDDEKLSWIGTMDANSLKSKVAAAIVAISSIQLLKIFMEGSDSISDQRMLVYVIVHLTFVVSAFAMGYLDKITKKPSPPENQ